MRTDLKDMLKATRLTVAGRLTEATAFLQHLLAGNRAGKANRRDDSETPPHRSANRTIADPGSAPRNPRPLLPDTIRAMLESGRPPAFKLPSEPPGSRAPGEVVASYGRARFLAASYSNAAGARPYKIFIPSGYRGEPVPLIVMLHGCTQSPDDFAVGTRMNIFAEQETCIVVYPAQTPDANGSRCWNWFAAEHQQRARGEPSLIAGITRCVMSEYAIDPDRVYAAGLSAGGAAAAVLGDAYPDLYAAIGVHSGLACGAAKDVPSALAVMRAGKAVRNRMDAGASVRVKAAKLPVIVFHGDADKTVHPTNGDAVIAGAIGAASLAKDVRHGSVPGGRAYTRILYCDANGRTTLEQWSIHGGGHAWAGGDTRGSYTDPSGPDATREMIRFFLEHPRADRPPLPPT